jgi:thioesterase domain-containing protein
MLAEAPTLAELARLLRAGRTRSALVPIRAEGSQPPIFFVHDLDGQVLRYAPLARRLPHERPFYVLDWRAVAADARIAGRIERMAARYVDEVRRRQPEGPYFLGGYCFGAVVAFEMAHQLRARGDSVALLALLGVTPFDFWSLVSGEARERYRRHKAPPGLAVRLAHHAAAARSLPAGSRLQYLARRGISFVRLSGDRLFRLVVRSGQMTADAMWRTAHDFCAVGDLPLPRWLQMPRHSNRLAFGRYSPRTYPGRAHVFVSSKTKQLYLRAAAADWPGLAGGGVEVRVVPGEDTAMLQEPAVANLAEMLGDCLGEPREQRLGPASP